MGMDQGTKHDGKYPGPPIVKQIDDQQCYGVGLLNAEGPTLEDTGSKEENHRLRTTVGDFKPE